MTFPLLSAFVRNYCEIDRAIGESGTGPRRLTVIVPLLLWKRKSVRSNYGCGACKACIPTRSFTTMCAKCDNIAREAQ